VQGPAEDDQLPADGAEQGGPWEREQHARWWWVRADERDARAGSADQRAADRDTAARARDELPTIRPVLRRPVRNWPTSGHAR
jgi:hypothetical protein